MCWVLVPCVGFILGIIMICFPHTHTHPKSNNCLGVKFVCATSLRVSVGVPAQHSLSIWNVLGWWLKCYLYSYDDANFQVCAFMIVAFSSSTFCVQEGGGCLGYVHIYIHISFGGLQALQTHNIDNMISKCKFEPMQIMLICLIYFCRQ